jgi:hypothetical protein
MRLKSNRKGLTAMVDAMIFIVIIGLAVSAMFALSNNNLEANDASAVSDAVFTAKVRMCDMMDTEESRLVSIADMTAYYILTGKGNVMDYIQSILDSLMQRPGSYLLNLSYRDTTVTIGTGHGDMVSGYIRDFTVTYGGTITADLEIY